MRPLALNVLSRRVEQSGFVISAAIIVPQIMVASASPWAGHLASASAAGRSCWPVSPHCRCAGCCSSPIRGPIPLIAVQTLDGVSATVLGLAVPLIAADITVRTGYLNLAIGSFGLAAGLGATASTTTVGWLADGFGAPVAFAGLALVGLAALATVWLMMPETRPVSPLPGAPAAVAA
jgi:hypothetical protein